MNVPGPRAVRRLVVPFAVLVAIAITLDLSVLAGAAGLPDQAAHHVAGGFRNTSTKYSYTLGQRALGVFKKHPPRPVRGLDVIPNDGEYVRKNGQHPTVTWVGHSTFLVQIGGLNILTDPHWGERTSPVKFAGPRRLSAPGIKFEDLPKIDVVVISHDHYDHLDEDTVQRLARDHRPRFVVPLGIGAWLRDRGIDSVIELDWWQRDVVKDVTLVCTPAQHSSGRGLRDQNMRLWSSWVMTAGDKKLFFAGDTGYDSGLKEIGRLGPFDIVLMPVGGYSDYTTHHPNHVNPEEAVQLFEDVGGKLMVPMHWGTFDLNREPRNEPPARLMKEALRRGIEERMAVLAPGETIRW